MARPDRELPFLLLMKTIRIPHAKVRKGRKEIKTGMRQIRPFKPLFASFAHLCARKILGVM
jgi:hypothetical protein